MIGVFGLLTGFLSGMLGIGGGIVMAPLLLYLPPMLGFESLPMRTIAGLTIVQGLVSSLLGSFAHHRLHFVSLRLSVVMGGTIFFAALAGGAGAKYVSNQILLFAFGGLALAAAVLMALPLKENLENPETKEMEFQDWRAVLVALTVGLLGGLVGQGGSFILIPLMIYFVRIPTRIAIGSNLAIVLLSSVAGFLGKAVTGQIEWMMSLPIVGAVFLSVGLGSLTSKKTPVKWLRRILAFIIAFVALQIWTSLLSG